jgi:hypothetical protein
MSLKNFFLSLLNLKKRTMTITRIDVVPITGPIVVSPANYNRYMEASGDITVMGHEFIISKDAVASVVGLGTLKKGDKLIDLELGTMTIKDPEPMFDLGGQIIAYRVRTS